MSGGELWAALAFAWSAGVLSTVAVVNWYVGRRGQAVFQAVALVAFTTLVVVLAVTA